MRKNIGWKATGMVILFFLLLQTMALSQTNKSPFEDLNNASVLPMLKSLPRTYGGLNITAADGRFLHDLIIENKYQRGLEIGTSNGYSGLWLGLAFQETGGELITLEIERKRAEEARENFKKAGLDQVIDARICDAFKEIPKIEGEFDFVFIDAWKPDYMEFLQLVRHRVKPGGVITAHNVLNAGREMTDFLDALKTDQGLET
ncbi:MAG: class I SAM-dependent methyltransferase, partial [Bacteroidota bacterium]|nr:class I SAM-dependent methyltransferase [Bacteroidota bacterium]